MCSRRQLCSNSVKSSTAQLIAAWSGFLLFIGAGAFAPGMAIHNETLAAQHPPHPEPVYYCATGVEMPLFEPCKEMKGQSRRPSSV
jgi:hypothetical protein